MPVAIYNNLGGKDKEALEHFNEPSWNNPVVRIVDADKRMIAPRVNGDYTTMGLSRAMVAALSRISGALVLLRPCTATVRAIGPSVGRISPII